MSLSVSVCIACHNQGKFLQEAIDSVLMQTYEGIEIVVLDDASTDNTKQVLYSISSDLVYKYDQIPQLKFYHSQEPSGSGEAFNKAIAEATGDIIVLLCADDVFTDIHVIDDIVNCFESIREIVHVSRWYHQFVDGDRHPVRAWRGENVVELANNPSGLAFRRSVMPKLSNKMFVEAPESVSRLISGILPGIFHAYTILRYDTVAVRVHKSTARSKDYYQKMWVSSPVEEWAKLGWKTNDFTHLIQVKNYFTTKAVLIEARNFIRINFFNIFNTYFIFMFIMAVFMPRRILIKLPDIYRATLGRWTTRQVMREK